MYVYHFNTDELGTEFSQAFIKYVESCKYMILCILSLCVYLYVVIVVFVWTECVLYKVLMI